MKKRFFLLAFCLLAVVFLLAGCAVSRNTGRTEHVHSYRLVSDSATCLRGGERVEVCLTCKQERRFSSLALGHDYEVTEHRNAACTVDGIHVEECSRCGARNESILLATGHTYLLDMETTASCDQGGERVEKCSACGDKKTTSFSPTAHKLVHYNGVSPTCTEAGFNAYDACANCGYTTYAVLAPLGHDKVTHEAQASTCSVPGNLAYETCSRCDYTTYQALPLNDVHTFQNGVCSGCNRAAPILSGKWRINDTINFDVICPEGETVNIDLDCNVNFSCEIPDAYLPTSETVNYSAFAVVGYRYYDSSSGTYTSSVTNMKYGDTIVNGFYTGWTEEYYQTIDFGSEYQEVDIIFYDWFVSNATKVE